MCNGAILKWNLVSDPCFVRIEESGISKFWKVIHVAFFVEISVIFIGMNEKILLVMKIFLIFVYFWLKLIVIDGNNADYYNSKN